MLRASVPNDDVTAIAGTIGECYRALLCNDRASVRSAAANGVVSVFYGAEHSVESSPVHSKNREFRFSNSLFLRCASAQVYPSVRT